MTTPQLLRPGIHQDGWWRTITCGPITFTNKLSQRVTCDAEFVITREQVFVANGDSQSAIDSGLPDYLACACPCCGQTCPFLEASPKMLIPVSPPFPSEEAWRAAHPGPDPAGERKKQHHDAILGRHRP